MACLHLHLKVSVQTTPGGAWIPANLHGGGGPPPPPGCLPPPPPPPPGGPPPPPPPGGPPPPPFNPFAPSAPPMPEGGFGSPNARRRSGDGDGDGGDRRLPNGGDRRLPNGCDRRVRPRLRKQEDSEEQTIEQVEAESENEGAYKKNPENALQIQKKKKKRSHNKKSLTQLPLLGELSADDTEKGGDKKRVQKDMKTSPEKAPQNPEMAPQQEFILTIEGPDLTQKSVPKSCMPLLITEDVH